VNNRLKWSEPFAAKGFECVYIKKIRKVMGMKNTLADLNIHLFAQLERLGDEELKGESLVEEITRAKAITGIANNIISTGSLVLAAQKFVDDKINADAKLPKMLEG
jgi:hypothetical protein